MDRTYLFVAIVCMIALELTHLKWIWWTYWHCRRCGKKNHECGHGAKWLFLL